MSFLQFSGPVEFSPLRNRPARFVKYSQNLERPNLKRRPAQSRDCECERIECGQNA